MLVGVGASWILLATIVLTAALREGEPSPRAPSPTLPRGAGQGGRQVDLHDGASCSDVDERVRQEAPTHSTGSPTSSPPPLAVKAAPAPSSAPPPPASRSDGD